MSVSAAADLIRSAEALLIGAGAGIGVDSGLPDFRGPEGFWKAYPMFRGKSFAEMSTPHWFTTDPELAWGFFGHRWQLYRAAVPHIGFTILQKWIKRAAGNGFVFTTNVDGQFQKSGFDSQSIVEQHGSIHFLQCVAGCGQEIWPAGDLRIDVDLEHIRARGPLPSCPACGALARPNILMFSDWQWDDQRQRAQVSRYAQWLQANRHANLVAIEIGAGLAIPTVRYECADRARAVLRINPRDAAPPQRGTALSLGAAEALIQIDQLLES